MPQWILTSHSHLPPISYSTDPSYELLMSEHLRKWRSFQSIWHALWTCCDFMSTERMMLKRRSQMDKTVHRPLFFCKTVEIERLYRYERLSWLKRIGEAGGKLYSSKGKEARKNDSIFLASSKTFPRPLIWFDPYLQARLSTFEAKMTARKGRCLIPMILRTNQ